MITQRQIIDGIIQREGGYSNRTADRGGPTKFGITQATLADWRKAPVTAADVEALTESEAAQIYAARYVNPYMSVPEPLRTLLADIAVTSWHDDAIRMLQQALRERGLYAGAIDGKRGPKTNAAIAGLGDASARLLFIAVLKLRSRQLINEALDDAATQAFIKSHPDQDIHNLRGWQNRCLEFLDALI
jgi:lysozyme family protein